MLERLDAAVVVRDPGTARSAEVFEGMRKQLLRISTHHRRHLDHLVTLADAVERGASIDLLRDRLQEFLAQLGVSKSRDTSIPAAFEITEGEGELLECIEPALIETLEDGRVNVLVVGKARRARAAQPLTSIEMTPSSGGTQTSDAHREGELKNPLRGRRDGERAGSRLASFIVATLALVAGLAIGKFVLDDPDIVVEPPASSAVTTTEVSE